MKNLRPIALGTLVALGFAAQPVAAATYDIALKLTTRARRVHSNGALKIIATATNNGPDTGEIFIISQTQSGLSITSGATCTFPDGFTGPGDGDDCEFSTVAAGQTVKSTLTLSASPTSQPVDAWFVSCATTGENPESSDPKVRNDCAVIVIRVLP